MRVAAAAGREDGMDRLAPLHVEGPGGASGGRWFGRGAASLRAPCAWRRPKAAAALLLGASCLVLLAASAVGGFVAKFVSPGSPIFATPRGGHRAPHRPQAPRSVALNFKQLLQFTEPETNVNVTLVGAMHFNPASVQLAADTVEGLGRDGKLGPVVIEVCDARWRSSRAMDPKLQGVLRSEMATACEVARSYNQPVVLGDQQINLTVERLKTNARETFADMVDPVQGWQRIARNITETLDDIVFWGGDDYLSAFAILDPRLVAGMPEAMFKYLLNFAVKLPLQTAGFLGLLILVDPTVVSANDLVFKNAVASDIASVGFGMLELTAFARIFLKAMLQERNEILARSILEQCRVYQGNQEGPPVARRQPESVVLVSESAADAGSLAASSEGGDRAVVAILGMSHCNGIMKLLKERRVA